MFLREHFLKIKIKIPTLSQTARQGWGTLIREHWQHTGEDVRAFLNLNPSMNF